MSCRPWPPALRWPIRRGKRPETPCMHTHDFLALINRFNQFLVVDCRRITVS